MRIVVALALLVPLSAATASGSAAPAGHRSASIGGENAGMSCGGSLVHLGDHTSAVHLKCGAPALKSTRYEMPAGPTGPTVTVEEWTYNQGPGNFLRILTFRNGYLVDLKLGAYVS